VGGLPFAPLVFAQGGLCIFSMPKNLRRVIGRGDLHFITFCCYQRRALLATEHARNLAVQILGETRGKFGFALVGYVIMPEHVHLLIGELTSVPPAIVMQVFKQRVSLLMRERGRKERREIAPPFVEAQEVNTELRRFWQRRYYDFNVYTRAKMREKLEYMHGNPVAEKLVEHPKDWAWSSWTYYATGDGLLTMDGV
jgi:putative transposase